MLIAGHVYVFWYVPISGNFHLYGQPNCQNKDVSDYGCKDFHNNVFKLIILIKKNLSIGYTISQSYCFAVVFLISMNFLFFSRIEK